MKRHVLKVDERKIVGKKIKKLRKEGLLPGNVYGRDITSTAVQVALKDFLAVYKETGETGLVDLELNGSTKPVLIHQVQRDHLTQLPLHADFYQVNLKEKVKTSVPVVLVGEPVAVTEKLGLLLQTLNQVEVEALPADLPENVEIDVTHLAAVNDQITVGDVKKIQGVDITTDTAQVIAKINELVSKEAEEQQAAEEAAAEEAKTEGSEAEGSEGEKTEEKSTNDDVKEASNSEDKKE